MDYSILIQVGVIIATIAGGVAVVKKTLQDTVNRVNKIERGLNAFHGKGTNPGAEPVYITRRECTARSDETRRDMTEVKTSIISQKHSIQSLEKFARWFLTTKENMSLKEADDILNGD